MTTSLDSSTTQKPLKKRAQLSHALIDVDFDDNPKIIDLAETHGEIAAWFCVKCILKISRATNAWITRSTAKGVARRTGIESDKAEAIIDHCLTQGIFEIENGFITNSRCILDQEKLASTRANALERQNKHKSQRSDNALPTRLPDTAPVTDTVTDSCNWLSNPFNWTDDQFSYAKRWFEHRKRKKKPLSDYQMELLLKDWNNDREGFINMVKHHSVNGHDNLYSENAHKNAKSGAALKPSQNVVNQMASDEAVKVFLRSTGHES